MQNKYGFREVMNMYQSTDNIRYLEEDIEVMLNVLEILPQQNKDDVVFEIMFFLNDLMVTEGTIDKNSGHGVVFGFNSKTKIWEEVNVSVATSDFVRGFSYGNIVIDEDGNPVGATKRPFNMKAEK